jgi:hypothetical protein
MGFEISTVAEKIVASYFKEHWIDARQGWWHKDK